MHREPEVLEAEAQVGKWLDCRARIKSKELAQLHSVKNGILRRACSTSQKQDADLGKKCSYAQRQVDEQPSKKFQKNGDKSAEAYIEEYTTIGLRISGYGAAEVYNDFAEELKYSEANPMCSIHYSRVRSR